MFYLGSQFPRLGHWATPFITADGLSSFIVLSVRYVTESVRLKNVFSFHLGRSWKISSTESHDPQWTALTSNDAPVTATSVVTSSLVVIDLIVMKAESWPDC